MHLLAPLALALATKASASSPILGVNCQDAAPGSVQQWQNNAACAKKINNVVQTNAGIFQTAVAALNVAQQNGDPNAGPEQAALLGLARGMSATYAPVVNQWFQNAEGQPLVNAQDQNQLQNNQQLKNQIQQAMSDIDVTRQSVAQTGATALCQAGDCATGQTLAQWWVQNQPASPQAYTALAKDQFGLQNYAGAEASATTALGLDPNQEDALSVRAASRMQLGNLAGAVTDGKAALGLNPNDKLASDVVHSIEAHSEGLNGKALDPTQMMRFMMNPQDNTTATLNGGVVNNGAVLMGVDVVGTSKEPWADEAYKKFQLGDYNAVISICDRVLAVDPNDADALLLRANAKNMIGDFEGAAADAAKALALKPSVDAYNARAWALNHLGRYQDAFNDADKAVGLAPNDPVAWLNRATAGEGLGRASQALEDYKRAAGLNPAFKGAFDSAYARLAAGGPGGPTGLGGFLGAHRGAGLGAAAFLVALGLGALALRARTPAGTPGRRSVSTGARSRLDTLPPELEEGAVLGGKYEVLAELGRGGMGVVYRGRDTVLERPIAIKKMRAELSTSAGEKERFLQEARLVAALRHPGIVAIHDIFEEGGDLYIVFELVEGRPLDALISESKALPLEECKRIMRPVCEALAYAHSKKIVHRDLKPSNIVVATDGGVKVMDFGIARQAKDTIARMSATDGVGTPAYMPPEQERGHVSKESDIYALGATLYEMATGRPPFRTGNFTLQKMEMSYTKPSRAKSGLPLQFDSLLAKALDADPEKRYHTAQDFWRALENVPEEKAAA